MSNIIPFAQLQKEQTRQVLTSFAPDDKGLWDSLTCENDLKQALREKMSQYRLNAETQEFKLA
jgi:hypothetical protein